MRNGRPILLVALVNQWSSIMGTGTPKFPDDKTAVERRKNLTDEQIEDLELAGGVEGGMQAGSAGGPGANPKSREGEKSAGQARRDKA